MASISIPKQATTVVPAIRKIIVPIGVGIKTGAIAFSRSSFVRNFSYTPILVCLLLAVTYFVGRYQAENDAIVEFSKHGTIAGAKIDYQNVATAQANQPTGDIAGTVATPQPTPVGTPPPVTNDEHVRGDTNGQITLVEYSDYECPFCKSFHKTIQNMSKNYPSNVRWVYRHFPLPFHANAQKEAEASECISELGGNTAFWKYTDLIFDRTTSNGTGFALTDLGPLAAEIGVNQTAFQTCLDSGKYAQKVADEMAAGQNAGVSGTPGTFLITKNGIKLLEGALSDAALKKEIDAVVQ